MKNKLLLPLLAVILGTIGALGSMLPQQAWYDANGAIAGGATEESIDIPSSGTCDLTGPNVCKIVVNSIEYNAYNSPTNAEVDGGMGTTGLLKFD